MKKLKRFLNKVILPTTKQETAVVCTMFVCFSLVVAFAIGEWHHSDTSPQTCSYEEVKAYTDGLTKTNPAKLAVVCANYIPEQETIEIPVCIEQDCVIPVCDCEPEREEGFISGKSEGWKDCDSITSEKDNPAKEVFSERNRRDSKEIFDNSTQR